ncbi:MAG: thiamine ABC transporter substrate-binding protein, partial [Alphaproteobacteria bacterium]|nr:thiamine ABC transporter substrate-binding protein [Alphaproteobacteria bacterium]
MRKSRLFPAALAAILPLVASPAASADRTLTVYTYESFIAEWGPGPKIEAAFETECGCDLKWVGVADGVALLNRLKLEGDRTEAGVVLGLDTNLVTEAKATGLFEAHGLDTSAITVPGDFSDDVFIPYDYGYFAVIYDTEAIADPPHSLKDLVEGDPEQKIVIEDPRTSTPGLGLLLWMK